MLSDTDALLRSIRRWVLVGVIVFGLGNVALADMAALQTGVQSGAYELAGYSGFIAAVSAGLMLLASFLPEPKDIGDLTE